MNLENSLKIISQCPVCHSKRDKIDAKLIDEQEDMHLLHIQCNNCGSCLVVLIFTSQAGISSVGVVTDLNQEDVIKFKDSQGVNSDDILTFYQESGRELRIVDILK